IALWRTARISLLFPNHISQRTELMVLTKEQKVGVLYQFLILVVVDRIRTVDAMRTNPLNELAVDCHNALPQRICTYLNARGIPDAVIDKHLLGWNGARITIPVFNREGELAFFKLARDPEDDFPTSPKMVTWPKARVQLYGWEQILANPEQIIICEGEFDRLILEANGFRAVTSTGGAGTFRPEWAKEFLALPEVFICFDLDEAGQNGALRVGGLIRNSRIVDLPDKVG